MRMCVCVKGAVVWLAAQETVPDGMDIDDALYGNEGGEDEQVCVVVREAGNAREQ
jgi:hypothetical protein